MEYLNGPPRKGCHSWAEAKLPDIFQIIPRHNLKGCHSRAEAKLPDIFQIIPRHNLKSPDNDILCAWSLTFDSLTPEIHGSDNLVFFL